MYSRSFSTLNDYISSSDADVKNIGIEEIRIYKQPGGTPDKDLDEAFKSAVYSSKWNKWSFVNWFLDDKKRIKALSSFNLRLCIEEAAKQNDHLLIQKIISQKYSWGTFYYSDQIYYRSEKDQNYYIYWNNLNGSSSGSNALCLAAQEGAVETVELLLKFGGNQIVSYRIRNTAGEEINGTSNPFAFAILGKSKGCDKTAKLLVDHLNISIDDLNTAIFNHKPDIALYILEKNKIQPNLDSLDTCRLTQVTDLEFIYKILLHGKFKSTDIEKTYDHYLRPEWSSKVKTYLEKASRFISTLDTYKTFLNNNDSKLIQSGGDELFNQVKTAHDSFDVTPWLTGLNKLPPAFFNKSNVTGSSLESLRRLYLLINIFSDEAPLKAGKYLVKMKKEVFSLFSEKNFLKNAGKLKVHLVESYLKTKLNEPFANLLLGLLFETNELQKEKYLTNAGPLFWGWYFDDEKIKKLFNEYTQNIKLFPKAIVVDNKDVKTTPTATAASLKDIKTITAMPIISAPPAIEVEKGDLEKALKESKQKQVQQPIKADAKEAAQAEGLPAPNLGLLQKTDQQRIIELETEVKLLRGELNLLKASNEKILKLIEQNAQPSQISASNLFAPKTNVPAKDSKEIVTTPTVEPA